MSNQKAAGRLPILLSVTEIGGYPDFTSLYESMGYHVVSSENVRKAVKHIRQYKPRVVVAEFNFQSDFRDRTSSLETLMSSTQGVAGTRMIVFYEKDFEPQYQRFLQNFNVAASLAFPVDVQQLRSVLKALLDEPQ